VDEVEVGEAEPTIALAVGDHETEVGLHEALQGLLVSLLDAARRALLILAGSGLNFAISRM